VGYIASEDKPIGSEKRLDGFAFRWYSLTREDRIAFQEAAPSQLPEINYSGI
jgi:hypothetical protein